MSQDSAMANRNDLEEMVQDLEQRTWAAKGAIEDLGSASMSQESKNRERENTKDQGHWRTSSTSSKGHFADEDQGGWRKNAIESENAWADKQQGSRKKVATKGEDSWADD